MEISPRAEVRCANEPVGEVTYLLVNHILNEVTHLVARDRKPPHEERLVPIQLIQSSSPQMVDLSCSNREYAALEPFNIVEFIEVPFVDRDSNTLVWPYVTMETRREAVEGKNIPPHELAFRRGAKVESTEEEIGKVDEFIIDPQTGHITHLLMKEGHLWGSRDIVIPLSAIEHIGEQRVYLKLSSQEVANLPHIPVKRDYTWDAS